MNFQDNVQFPGHCRPLPPGYRIIQLDSGHYIWVLETPEREIESGIHWDKWAVWRGVFADAKERAPHPPTETKR